MHYNQVLQSQKTCDNIDNECHPTIVPTFFSSIQRGTPFKANNEIRQHGGAMRELGQLGPHEAKDTKCTDGVFAACKQIGDVKQTENTEYSEWGVGLYCGKIVFWTIMSQHGMTHRVVTQLNIDRQAMQY